MAAVQLEMLLDVLEFGIKAFSASNMKFSLPNIFFAIAMFLITLNCHETNEVSIGLMELIDLSSLANKNAQCLYIIMWSLYVRSASLALGPLDLYNVNGFWKFIEGSSSLNQRCWVTITIYH